MPAIKVLNNTGKLLYSQTVYIYTTKLIHIEMCLMTGISIHFDSYHTYSYIP